MGARGPIPNRSENLARPRERKGSDEQEVKRGEMRPVVIPEPDPEWHSIALMVWESLSTSGQADFYQQSDWAYAYNLCEELTVYKTNAVTDKETGEILYYKRSPEMFKGLLSGLSALLMTEGDRRRVRVELTAPEPEEQPAAVLAIADYRAGLEAAPDPEEESA